MATTKFTKRVPKKTPKRDIEDPPEKPTARGKRSPSGGARGQKSDVHVDGVHHKERGTGTKAKVAKKVAEPAAPRRRKPAPGAAVDPETGGAPPRRKKAAAKAPEASPAKKTSRTTGIKEASQLSRRETRRTSSADRKAEKANATKRSGRGAGKGTAKIPRGGSGKTKG